MSIRECYYSGCDKQKELKNIDKYLNALIEQETVLIGDLNNETIKKYNHLKLSPSEYLEDRK